MPPRWGWGIFGLGFYKDGAPMALGKMWQKDDFIAETFEQGQNHEL